MLIRPATSEDWRSIAAVQVEGWQGTYSKVLPAEYLAGPIKRDLEQHWSKWDVRSDDVVLVADDDDEVVGFIAIWCRPDPFIDNLHVKPSRRSKGLGANLMRRAASELTKGGRHTAYLWVVESNERAIRFYERLGGVGVDRAFKDLLGHDVPNIKMVWSDISTIGALK